MLEIDTVRRAIESHHPYELTDKISDTYFEVIELATRPHITDANRNSIQRRRAFLDEREDLIINLLKDGQWLAQLRDEDEPLHAAYLRTLAQVDSVVATT